MTGKETMTTETMPVREGESSPASADCARVSDVWCHKWAMKHAMRLAPNEMTLKDLRYMATRIAHLYRAVVHNHLPNAPESGKASDQ